MCDQNRKVQLYQSRDWLNKPNWVVEIEWIEDDLIQQRFFEMYDPERANEVKQLLSSGVAYAEVRSMWVQKTGPFKR